MFGTCFQHHSFSVIIYIKSNKLLIQEMSGFSLSYSNSQSLYIKDGWFSETEAMWPGQKFCIEVDEVLANGKSKFQVSDDNDDW